MTPTLPTPFVEMRERNVLITRICFCFSGNRVSQSNNAAFMPYNVIPVLNFSKRKKYVASQIGHCNFDLRLKSEKMCFYFLTVKVSHILL